MFHVTVKWCASLCIFVCWDSKVLFFLFLLLSTPEWIYAHINEQNGRIYIYIYKYCYKRNRDEEKKIYRSQTHVERNYNFHMQKAKWERNEMNERERIYEIIIEVGTNMESLKCQ